MHEVYCAQRLVAVFDDGAVCWPHEVRSEAGVVVGGSGKGDGGYHGDDDSEEGCGGVEGEAGHGRSLQGEMVFEEEERRGEGRGGDEDGSVSSLQFDSINARNFQQLPSRGMR